MLANQAAQNIASPVAACRDAPTFFSVTSSPTPFNKIEPVVLPAIDQPEQSALPSQYAANNNLRFEHITVDDGLSQNGAYAIIQDSKGFMTSFFEDAAGDLWLGLLAILVVVVGGYRLRVRNVEARSRELESEVDSRTKELAALPKTRPRNLKRKPRAGAAQDLGFFALYTGRPRIGRDRRLHFNGWPGQVTLFQFVRYGIAWGAAVVILVVWKRRL